MVSKFTILLIIAILITLWLYFNPRDKFGYSTFGLTTYNIIPIPYYDLKIYSNGHMSFRKGKDHFFSFEEFNESKDLLNKTEFLIIGIGYDGLMQVDSRIFNSTFVPIEVMKTPEALERFNELKDQGKKVAAIIHSTC